MNPTVFTHIKSAAVVGLLLYVVAFAGRADTIGVTSTPTATPCASVGSWAEQAPYPIAVSGNAVSSQGGDVYSFGGIANNIAIANAYKYTPATNIWTPIAPLPSP